ncbi:retron Ec67 family RNA-directed DNA polymerase/endonuclease [Variovorax sp. PCZ-1]|uniref:retron Ec67 family RNA-directed DNA polymerase/endonuclease n=1 Tax=Variovorax sp. PCZ-1 TaxID=2835533 RepID=UPI001BCC3A10|nr:retron Ec67 family RNA-directed DNA polymerase/endonuclease [Variovorax sp. PCZ-1]MBS7806538.1 retron Ec67 family RNA-directed DNA polymerase/endonuclease [Variovorax sp. PCZ-1]
MSQLIALKSCINLSDVAVLLGYKPSTLSYLLYKIGEESKYSSFEIPKKGGGTRRIEAPQKELKLLQRKVADLLQNCFESADLTSPKYKSNPVSYGFIRGLSIIDNAQNHRSQRFVFNIDIQDFFGSINFGRVRGFFIKDRDFSLQPQVATVIAQIACFKNRLPQGSPCSPVISNLVGHILDMHLIKLAARTGCRYSRYADDLTFSTSKRDFPRQVAFYDEEKGLWHVGDELKRLLELSGFTLNSGKTRMQNRDSRQQVTGLVVNKRVNVSKEYRKTTRAMVHRLFTKGSFFFTDESNLEVKAQKESSDIGRLHGMLGHIYHVDTKCKTKIESSTNPPQKNASTYRRFLIYKELYATNKPIIICEGKTDPVYLVHAIRSLHRDFPMLAYRDAENQIRLSVRLLKYADKSMASILGLNGGVGDLRTFIDSYRSDIKRFNAPGKFHPVIILIDNDDGAKPILSIVKSINPNSTFDRDSFSHIVGNLYVVKTPLLGSEKSCIEDFFDGDLKSTMIDGKQFSLEKDANPEHYFGKVVFAHKVVRPQADKIDFSNFRHILKSMQDIITEFSSQKRI